MMAADEQQCRFCFTTDDCNNGRCYYHEFFLGGINCPGHLTLAQLYPRGECAYENIVFSSQQVQR